MLVNTAKQIWRPITYTFKSMYQESTNASENVYSSFAIAFLSDILFTPSQYE